MFERLCSHLVVWLGNTSLSDYSIFALDCWSNFFSLVCTAEGLASSTYQLINWRMSSTLGACLKFLEAAHRFFPNTAILFIKRAKRVSKARQLANEIDSYISNGIKGRTYHHLCVLLVKSKSQFHPTFKGRQLHTGVNSRR